VEMFFKISHISTMRSPDDGWSELADSPVRQGTRRGKGIACPDRSDRD
jgi:hypothetical protein